MRPVREFHKQLTNLRLEATVIANYVFAEMAVQHAASKSKQLHSLLNRTPMFWNTCFAAFQSSAYLALGRVFDLKSPYNIEALMAAIEADIGVFSRKSLEARKREAGLVDEARLKQYVANSHVPTAAMTTRIRRAVKRRRLVYDRAIKPVRHRYLAHRQVIGDAAQDLYGQGKLKDMWKLSVFLNNLHDQLWQLYTNGRKPDLHIRSRYSPSVMYDNPANYSGPHERIVSDTRALMDILKASDIER